MQLYLATNKVKTGPFTQLRVKEMLAEGECSADDLAWHEGLDKWMPLSEIPSAEAIFRDSKAEESASAEAVQRPIPNVDTFDEELGSKQVRPFVRFFARFLDLHVYGAIAWIALGGYEIPEPPKTEAEIEPFILAARNFLFLEAVILFSWSFIEAFLMSNYGTTLGKYLLRIEVRNNDGSRLSYKSALFRSLHIWMSGYAFGLPIFRLLVKIPCYFRLVKEGITPWDRDQNLRVTHSHIGDRRVILAILIFLSAGLALNLAMAA